ncbi:nucleotide disphospho-sugar-binding domain-containing protein [Longimicrobium sp.]|uniref:glycosyltransferase n=1 Tax=Longimicrobium sp. TaxID=2029185 RepID=UPI002F948E7F
MSNEPRAARRRILFFAEAGTLSHVTRPLQLARALPPEEYEVHFACHPRFDDLISPVPGTRHHLDSISSERFMRAAKLGTPMFGVRTLRRYVREDLALIHEVRPELVVGDLRQSLSISCPLAGVPLVNLVDAYHSPYARISWELAEHPFVGLVSDGVAQRMFSLFFPFNASLHTVPLNVARLSFRQGVAGFRLHREFVYGDWNLYCDLPELVPMDPLPHNHRFIGPVHWSPTVEPPAWWNRVPDDRPVVYLGLGSSGPSDVLGTVLEALASMPVYVLLAGGAGTREAGWPGNVFAAPYLPGDEACARARVVICNGGSTAGQQSLAAGRPFLGVATNIDQVMFTRLAERTGAARLLKAHNVTRNAVRGAVSALLNDPAPAAAAARLADSLAGWDAAENFRQLVGSLCGTRAMQAA